MKRTLAIALALGATCGTVPGAPTCALAQSDTGLIFEAPDVLSPAQPSITVHLWAQFPAADWAFAQAKLDVLASEPGLRDPESVLWPGGVGTSPGVPTGSAILDVVAAQLQFPVSGIYADPANPIELWRATFEVTDFTPRVLTLSTNTREFVVYPDKESPISETRDSHEAFHEIRVIPAPGALGLGALCGAVAVRRRRI